MNERIQQLAEQAGVHVITTKGMEDIADGCYVVSPAQLQQFAELIVKECIEALRLVPYHSLDIDFDEEVIYQDAIRKHFGVEL